MISIFIGWCQNFGNHSRSYLIAGHTAYLATCYPALQPLGDGIQWSPVARLVSQYMLYIFLP